MFGRLLGRGAFRSDRRARESSDVFEPAGRSSNVDHREFGLSQNAGGNTGDPEVSLLTALREQLGLRLEPTCVRVDVVVVDRIARAPTGSLPRT